ncbi:MAG: hypothetical protein CMC13_04310 [Flavobacteriaceae bacterium]|mgnify:CR=1 FL=1|nr:hypothetical protein [Flavobacteriaceae bacterium]|tara:strand:+ start:5770 stop:6078 length:309 start_codon:yes stop_codon:yes gene_type:complete
MQNDYRKEIKLKIAITLNLLLAKKKKASTEKLRKEDIVDSYNEIALNADIRKATVSDTFNARTIPNSLTLIEIVEAMDFNLNDFGKVYDSITTNQIIEFNKK